MSVVVSDHTNEKIFHRRTCPYALRISDQHRMEISKNWVAVHGYRKCKCCGKPEFSIRAILASAQKTDARRKMKITYQKSTNTLYLRTGIGFWKIFWKEDLEGFLLYHLNWYDAAKSTEELMSRSFHRQSDVKVTGSLVKLLDYVEKHDRAKQIIAKDFKQLPKRTKRQRKYYKRAERADRKKQADRVMDLFDRIEQQRTPRTSLL